MTHQVDHALGERGLRAAARERAGARGDDLRAGRGAVHLAAEHRGRGDDAGHVRPVRGGGQTDVDEGSGLADVAEGREVDVVAVLHDEGNPLVLGGAGLVDAEVAHLVVDPVRRHAGCVGEVVVAVGIHPHLVSRRLVEHPEGVPHVSVAVEVSREVAARRRVLVEVADQEVAGGRAPVVAGPAERRSAASGRHLDPRAVAVLDRIGRGDPVDDLGLAVGGLLQRRVRDVDARVQHADDGASTVPFRIRLHEGGGAGLVDGQVRVGGGRARVRSARSGVTRGPRRGCAGVQFRGGHAVGAVEVDRLDGRHRGKGRTRCRWARWRARSPASR